MRSPYKFTAWVITQWLFKFNLPSLIILILLVLVLWTVFGGLNQSKVSHYIKLWLPWTGDLPLIIQLCLITLPTFTGSYFNQTAFGAVRTVGWSKGTLLSKSSFARARCMLSPLLYQRLLLKRSSSCKNNHRSTLREWWKGPFQSCGFWHGTTASA